MSARRPAGYATGALGGQYPVPALGLPPSAGVVLYDDFLLDAGTIAGLYGDRLWSKTDLTAAPTMTSPTPGATTENGLLRMQTTIIINSGGVLTYGGTPFYRMPPPGSIWAAKVFIGSASAYEFWSGFSHLQDRVVTVANDFVGIRQTGGNLFGVCRDGAAETTVDLLVDAETTYITAGFEVTLDGNVQFFTLDTSDVQSWARTNVGSEVTTNLPNQSLYPVALGLYTTAAASKTAYIDWWSLGGRTAR